MLQAFEVVQAAGALKQGADRASASGCSGQRGLRVCRAALGRKDRLSAEALAPRGAELGVQKIEKFRKPP
ncbi:hypothetical protein GCM10022631_19420 [Deinococcus rubellus]